MNIILQYIIGGVILLVFFGLIAYFGKKAMKEGKIDKHWHDY